MFEKIKYWYLIKKLNKRFPTNEMKQLDEYKLNKLKIDNKYNKISDYDYEIKCSEILNTHKSPVKQKTDILNIKKKYKKISDIDYLKEVNDINGKEWFQVYTKIDDNDEEMSFMVEYNDTFLNNLSQKGFIGTPDEMVDKWLRLWFVSMLDESDINDIMEKQEQTNSLRKGVVK